MKGITLDRLLQSQGLGTRKWCQQLIAAGELRVDGAVVTDHHMRIVPTQHQFHLFDAELVYRTNVYIALNKPQGYECSRKASHHPGILSLLPEEMTWRDVQPVGRLDHDTTGLLLLSDDGQFIHRQASPRHHVAKVYRAQVREAVDERLLRALADGVQLHDEPNPIRALHCVAYDANSLEITLDEGKYHQVRRMLAAAGHHCVALQRVAIGGLHLDSLGLSEGSWRHLDATQLAALASK